jgi:hypothetical protein
VEAFITPTDLEPYFKQQAGQSVVYAGGSINLGIIDKKWAFFVRLQGIRTVPAVENRKAHVAGVYANKTVRLFVDGKLVGEKIWDPPTHHKVPFQLGISFNGLLSEVRISKVARYEKDFMPRGRHEPDADTLALYHFDEGQGDLLKDSSGNNHHGKIVGAKWVNADGTPIAPRPARYALQFDGKGKVGPLPMPFEPSKPFTIEAYLTRHEHNAERSYTRPIDGKLAGISGNLEQWSFWTKVKNGGYNQIGGPAKNGVTTHVAGVFSGTEILLFVDGKLVAKKNVDSKLLASGPEALELGAVYRGLIHQVRMSTVARYDKDFTPARRFERDGDTLGLYHFDEGQGDVLKDSSANGHHGKIVGAKWVNADGTPIEAAGPK